MLIHIVRHNERIEDIMDAYHVSFDDIKVNNLHITDFKKLQGGVKLKIPFLSAESKQVLEASESFISDYYPSLEKLDNQISNIENSAKAAVEEEDLFAEFDNETSEAKAPLTTKEPIKEYIRPQNSIPIPEKKKSIYPHFIKNEKN